MNGHVRLALLLPSIVSVFSSTGLGMNAEDRYWGFPSAASTQVVPNGGKRKETTGATTIVQLPLAFVRSGWTNVSTEYEGAIWRVGYEGDSWARTAVSTTFARYLYLSPTVVGPSNSAVRWAGLSLR